MGRWGDGDHPPIFVATCWKRKHQEKILGWCWKNHWYMLVTFDAWMYLLLKQHETTMWPSRSFIDTAYSCVSCLSFHSIASCSLVCCPEEQVFALGFWHDSWCQFHWDFLCMQVLSSVSGREVALGNSTGACWWESTVDSLIESRATLCQSASSLWCGFQGFFSQSPHPSTIWAMKKYHIPAHPSPSYWLLFVSIPLWVMLPVDLASPATHFSSSTRPFWVDGPEKSPSHGCHGCAFWRIYKDLKWLKQCHKLPMTGNDLYQYHL